MTSEAGDTYAARQSGVGTLSAEMDATQCPQKDARDDSSSAADIDDVKTSSGLESSTDRLGVTGSSLLTVADRLKEKLCRARQGDEGVDKWTTTSGDDASLASRENSLRDCAMQDHHHQQQPLFSGSRSQYHSIQQLSRPSANLADAPGRHLFAADSSRSAYQLDNSPAIYRHCASFDPGSAGRYFAESSRTGDGTNEEVHQSQEAAESCRSRRYDGDSDDDDIDDEGSAYTESAVDCDERPTDADRCSGGTEVRARESTPTAVEVICGRAWSGVEARQNSGAGNGAVHGDELEAKRARVEHIVRSMRTPPSDGEQSSVIIQQQQQLTEARRQRRKQFAPLQHQHQLDERRPPHAKRPYLDDDDEDSERDVDDAWDSQPEISERDALRLGLQNLQDRLADMQKKCSNYANDSNEDDVIVDVGGNDVRADDEPIKRLDADDAVIGADFNRNEILRADNANSGDAGANDDDDGPRFGGSLEALARMLKAEINDSVARMVDEALHAHVARHRRVAVGGGSGDAGVWTHVEPSDGRLTPTRQSTLTPTSSPDQRLPAPTCADGDAASTAAVPPPLTPIRASADVDLRFPVPPMVAAAGLAGGNVAVMERAAAAAKLMADRYSAAAMAAYLDNTFLLHGKTAFEMPPPSASAAASASSAAAATYRLFTPTPYYPTAPQHAALQSHVIKVSFLTRSLPACERGSTPLLCQPNKLRFIKRILSDARLHNLILYCMRLTIMARYKQRINSRLHECYPSLKSILQL